METRFYVCGLGYDKNHYATDYERFFGDFDTYEEAYELFVKLQCKDTKEFFDDEDTAEIVIQIEECEETDDAIACIDVRNEWWIEKEDK